MKIYNNIPTKFIQAKNYLHQIYQISLARIFETDQLDRNTEIGIRKLGSADKYQRTISHTNYIIDCASTHKIYIICIIRISLYDGRV